MDFEKLLQDMTTLRDEIAAAALGGGGASLTEIGIGLELSDIIPHLQNIVLLKDDRHI